MPSFVQGNNALNNASASTLACAYSKEVAEGDLLVAAYGGHSATLGATISDTMGNKWVPLTPITNSNIPHTIGISYTLANASGTPSVTLNCSAATYLKLAVHEYNGANTLDRQAGATGNSATFSSGTVVTTQATELIFGWVVGNSGVTSPGSGFTAREVTSQLTEDLVSTAAGSYAATAAGPSAQWLAMVATFYEQIPTVVLTTYDDSGGSRSTTVAIGGIPIPVTPPVIS